MALLYVFRRYSCRSSLSAVAINWLRCSGNGVHMCQALHRHQHWNPSVFGVKEKKWFITWRILRRLLLLQLLFILDSLLFLCDFRNWKTCFAIRPAAHRISFSAFFFRLTLESGQSSKNDRGTRSRQMERNWESSKSGTKKIISNGFFDIVQRLKIVAGTSTWLFI